MSLFLSTVSGFTLHLQTRVSSSPQIDHFGFAYVNSSSVQQNTTVHLDNGEYWSNRAAAYKGKPHRAIFEDSLEKIYRNMYKKASGTISKRKIHS